MPLKYNPKDAVTAWPDKGPDNRPIAYDAVLRAVEDKTSKAGNSMQVWTIEVYDRGGRSQTIDDYVVVPAATFKIRQLARALGREKYYEAGEFQAEEHVNARLSVNLNIEQQEGFDDKNKIGRYLAPSKAEAAPNMRIPRQAAPPQPAAAPFGNETHFKEDDIPF